MLRLLLLLAIAPALSAVLAPVIFVPGYLGNPLLATITRADAVPLACEGLVPLNEPFTVLYNATLALKSPDCIYALLTVAYNSSSQQFSNIEGVQIGVRNFGGFDGIMPTYLPFLQQLKDWGYSIGRDAFGAPFDYRYMSPEGLAYSGFISDMKDLVEKAFLRSGRNKVVLVGHSNGGPTIYSFLQSMTQPWKDTYISAIVGLSGNYLGQMNMVNTFLKQTKDVASQEMFASWEANYLGMPWGDYAPLAGIPIVTTYTQDPSRTTNYTTKHEDVVKLFQSLGRNDWAEKATVLNSKMDRSAHPGVDSFCYYGSQVQTSYSFSYAGAVQDGVEPTVGYMEGDGNQDIIDNTFCKGWASQVLSKKYVTEDLAFPGVHHMGMPGNTDVLAALHTVLTRNN